MKISELNKQYKKKYEQLDKLQIWQNGLTVELEEIRQIAKKEGYVRDYDSKGDLAWKLKEETNG